MLGPLQTVVVARYSPPPRTITSLITASSSRSLTSGAIASSNAAIMSITISAFTSSNASSCGVLTRRASCVTGAESRIAMPRRWRATYPGAPSRSIARISAPAPLSPRMADSVSSAHRSASACGSSKNSQACMGRTSGARDAERCIEFVCSNRIGVPSWGTTAHRTNVLIAYTGIALAPVAYRTFGSLKSTQTSTPRLLIAAWSLLSRSMRSASTSYRSSVTPFPSRLRRPNER